jgi:hypothetical protein
VQQYVLKLIIVDQEYRVFRSTQDNHARNKELEERSLILFSFSDYFCNNYYYFTIWNNSKVTFSGLQCVLCYWCIWLFVQNYKVKLLGLVVVYILCIWERFQVRIQHRMLDILERHFHVPQETAPWFQGTKMLTEKALHSETARTWFDSKNRGPWDKKLTRLWHINLVTCTRRVIRAADSTRLCLN